MEIVNPNLKARYRSLAVVAIVLLYVARLLGSDSKSPDTLLLLGAKGAQFEECKRGLSDELGVGFFVATQLVDSSTTVAAIGSCVGKTRPKAVILQDNRTVSLFARYQMDTSPATSPIPSIACMGVYLGRAIRGIKNSSAVAFEVPIVTSVVGLRSVSGTEIRSVGIIARPFMKEFIDSSKISCGMEKIALVPEYIEVQAGDYGNAIDRALKKLLVKEGIDALWIPNDVALLRPELLRDHWIPAIHSSRKPVIVGVPLLANPDLEFGTLCVSPDPLALGGQIAQLVTSLKESGWAFSAPVVEPPLGIIKVFNVRQGKMIFKGRTLHLDQVDKVLE